MASHKKHTIQNELEELSWEFMVEAERIKKEAEDDFLEEVEEVNETVVESFDRQEDKQEDYRQEIDSWYKAGDYGVNDMGRDRGIVFDEDKLEAARVSEWHKAPKIRQSWVERFLKGVAKVVLWPFKTVAFLVIIFFRGLFSLLTGLGKLIYNILRGIVVAVWQIMTAFKYVWVYLFGEPSWPSQQELEPARVEAESVQVKLNWSVWKPVAGFAIVALVLVLPFQIYLSYNKAQGIKGQVLGAAELGLTHLEQAGMAGMNFDFDTAGDKFNLAEREFTVAQESVDQLGLVANSLAVLIPDVEAGQKLLKVARESAQVGQHLTNIADSWGKFSADVDLDQVEMAGMEDETDGVDWVKMEDELEMALIKVYSINSTLNEINLANTQLAAYQPQLEALKQQMPELVGWLASSRDIFEILLHLMGTDEPRRWMLVFQNNSELRPTGGFMGSYAIMDTKDGQIKDIQVPGGGFYDLKGSLAVQVEAPYPFQIFSPIWQPWNANWFPDWPSSAEKIMWFYDKSGGSTLDGVIAFTPNVLEKLLALTGEIEMPEYETSVNQENFVRLAQIEVELEYDKEENQPKKFIGDLMPKILEKVMELKNDQMLDLWQVISDSLKQKHLLVYLAKPELQSRVEDFGWAGQVINQPNDYLMVVHTNVAGGKTDRVVKTKIEHQVKVLANGSMVDTVVLTKTHEGQVNDVFEGHVNSDYIRFYVPQGSQLLSAEGFDGLPSGREFQIALNAIPVDEDLSRLETNLQIDIKSGVRITDEFGKTVFANWMQVAPGETKTVTIKYLLPFRFDMIDPELEIAVKKEDYSLWDLIKQYFLGKDEQQPQGVDEYIYSLLVQKQSGTQGYELISSFKADENWKIKDYLPKAEISPAEQGIKFSGDLVVDEFYGVVLDIK